MKIYQVLVERRSFALSRFFSYCAKDEMRITEGMRVRVPFNDSTIVGLVCEIVSNEFSQKDYENSVGYKLLNIIEVLDVQPILNRELMALALKLSEYYIAPLISIINLMVPNFLKVKTYANDVEKFKDFNVEGIAAKDNLSNINVDSLIHNFSNTSRESILFYNYQYYDNYAMITSCLNEVLFEKKQALIVFPDTEALYVALPYFLKNFSKDLVYIHNEMTFAERNQIYKSISDGKYSIVLGTGLASFMPLKSLSFVGVIDEESPNYKLMKSPFLNYVDVLQIRARAHKAKLAYFTSSPSVGLYHKAMNNNLLYVENNDPLFNIVQVIDLSVSKNISAFSSILSNELVLQITKTMEKKKTSLLFLNKKGYSSMQVCRVCGKTVKCPNCGMTLNYYKNDDSLRCASCAYKTNNVEKCDQCGHKSFMRIGFGLERLSQEILKAFPNAKILIVDAEKYNTYKKLNAVRNQIEKHSYDIVISTDILSRFKSIANVDLVSCVLPDIGLSLKSFNAEEKVFQFLKKCLSVNLEIDSTKYVVQTYDRKNKAISAACYFENDQFYFYEINKRRQTLYEPFVHLIVLHFLSSNKSSNDEYIKSIKAMLLNKFGKRIRVLGPKTSLILRGEKTSYEDELLIKYKTNDVKTYIASLLKRIKEGSKVEIQVDIKPIDY